MSSITLENVNVHYPVLNDHYLSIRRAFLRGVTGGRMYREDAVVKQVHALKDISFEAKDGDRIALIGSNGAGKSTLLKTIGGYILPDRGQLTVDGVITSLFSVNGGMDVERTGYDNIYLMGRLLGISKREMAGHLPDIESFSELGEFLKLPVRSYSDGMKVRLGVAVVTCVHPDILVLDEAIGAGDAHFIDKATRRAQKLYDRARIIIMASHSPEILQHLCNQAFWIEGGRIVKRGGVEEVHAAYLAKALQQ
jgi:ABC-2 type transport system ATP-binding protein/lipopolysaccharide transport system ATP-binding protein